MRRLFLTLAVAALAFSACNKNKTDHLDEAARAATAAEAYIGDDERDARRYLEELAQILADNSDSPDRAEGRIEAYLNLHRDELIQNARALEAILASKTGDAKAVYEEQFNDYLSPALHAWFSQARQFSEKYPQAYRRIDRLMKNFMNRNTAPNASIEAS